MAFITVNIALFVVTAYLHDLLLLIYGKQIWYLPCVQDTVDIFQKSLVFDMSVS